jgi:hypothetical protein
MFYSTGSLLNFICVSAYVYLCLHKHQKITKKREIIRRHHPKKLLLLVLMHIFIYVYKLKKLQPWGLLRKKLLSALQAVNIHIDYNRVNSNSLFCMYPTNTKISQQKSAVKKSADKDKYICCHKLSAPPATSSCPVIQTLPSTFVEVAVVVAVAVVVGGPEPKNMIFSNGPKIIFE